MSIQNSPHADMATNTGEKAQATITRVIGPRGDKGKLQHHVCFLLSSEPELNPNLSTTVLRHQGRAAELERETPGAV